MSGPSPTAPLHRPPPPFSFVVTGFVMWLVSLPPFLLSPLAVASACLALLERQSKTEGPARGAKDCRSGWGLREALLHAADPRAREREFQRQREREASGRLTGRRRPSASEEEEEVDEEQQQQHQVERQSTVLTIVVLTK